MWVLITQRGVKPAKGAERSCLENDYVGYWEGFGVKLVQLPNLTRNIKGYLEELPIKAIIISGGGDINPELCAKKPLQPDTNTITGYESPEYSEARDRTERELLDIAVKKRIPVLGICRGFQFINVYFGGSIIQDIKAQLGSSVNHVASVHELSIVSKDIRALLGNDKIMVNSYNNHGITSQTLSPELRAFAISEADGVIEGIYHPKLPIAGIQWHPERKSPDDEPNSRLVRAFLEQKLFWQPAHP